MAGRGLCKVILVGNLGQNPEVRYMPQGGAVANISIATSESWRDKATGEMKEQTEWHRVVIYQRLAEIAGEYLRKGSKVYIEGKLKTRKWTDKEGVERYTTEIIANELQLLDSRNESQSPDFGTNHEQYPQTPTNTMFPSGKGGTMGGFNKSASMDDDSFLDDIPF